jgi:predicted enzyme related to lactoylglutathione lyase
LLFQTDWYVHLKFVGWEIGFLKPNPPQKLPVFQHAQPSRGLTFAVEVPDVRAVYQQLTERGIDTLGKPEEFPNGEISFSVVDPAGTILNLVEIRPESSEIVRL